MLFNAIKLLLGLANVPLFIITSVAVFDMLFISNGENLSLEIFLEIEKYKYSSFE